MAELFDLAISEGALDAAFRRAKPCFDAEVGAILARLRRARVVCSDETSIRVAGKTCWDWVFQNAEVVIHVIRNSRGAGVVGEVMEGHRPAIWVSGAQQGHAVDWQICLAHQLRDCQFAIEAGDAIFAPRMKALPPRATLHGYLQRRNYDCTLEKIHCALHQEYREQVDRDARSTACVIDSQSVKNAEKGRSASTPADIMRARKSMARSAISWSTPRAC